MTAPRLAALGGRLLAGIGLMLWETPLLAQASPAPASQTASSTNMADEQASAAGDAEGPMDIFVTATRRAANVQEIPVSVTAVTGPSLQQHNVHDLRRLDMLVPGLKVGASGPDARPAIRGTRTQQVVGNADPSVAFYSDGLWQHRIELELTCTQARIAP